MHRYILCLLLVLTACNIPYLESPAPIQIPENPLNITNTITIANWNLQVFGPTKASKPELLQLYADKIDNFDIIFVQEIRDASQTAFPKLCALLPDYKCLNSSRAGRTSSKEQVGIIYRHNITITDWTDYNPDPEDRWERPPLEVFFQVNDYTFTVYNMHIKPDDVQSELDHLQSIINNEGNTLIIGDLNADCNYYDSQQETEFDTWHWMIKDTYDTTSSNTNCAYDRIILNNDMFDEHVATGITKKDITKEVSDHYIVWTQIKI